MTEIIKPTRANRAWVEVERVDKGGRIHKTKNHVTVTAGSHSAKEMEKVVIPEMAQEFGVSEDRIKFDTYNHDEAPMEVNPRHRGTATRWERPKEATEVKTSEFQKVRTHFNGVELPQTPEELEAYLEEWRERQSFLREQDKRRLW